MSYSPKIAPWTWALRQWALNQSSSGNPFPAFLSILPTVLPTILLQGNLAHSNEGHFRKRRLFWEVWRFQLLYSFHRLNLFANSCLFSASHEFNPIQWKILFRLKSLLKSKTEAEARRIYTLTWNWRTRQIEIWQPHPLRWAWPATPPASWRTIPTKPASRLTMIL